MLIRLIVPGEHARVEDLNTSLEAVLTRHGIDAGVRADVRLIVEELASNAIAYGGGCEISMACDLRIIAASARMALPEVKLGVVPGSGGLFRLPELVGPARALELMYLGDPIGASEAERMGLVNEVVPDDGLEAAVERWLDEIDALSPRYLEIAKTSSNQWWNLSKDNMAANLGALVQAIGSEDMLEGARAFLDKRKPDFRGARRATKS